MHLPNLAEARGSSSPAPSKEHLDQRIYIPIAVSIQHFQVSPGQLPLWRLLEDRRWKDACLVILSPSLLPRPFGFVYPNAVYKITINDRISLYHRVSTRYGRRCKDITKPRTRGVVARISVVGDTYPIAAISTPIPRGTMPSSRRRA